MELLGELNSVQPMIGNTALVKLKVKYCRLYAKLEYGNFSGSVKDRAAHYILSQAITSRKVNRDTVVVESSSGNFAIALASLCRLIGLKFTAVIDENINSQYEKILGLISYDIVKVKELDETGGYLLNRIKTVKEICARTSNSFWPNQYNNADNYLAYYNSLGIEFNQSFADLNYVFVGVSSGGTITGISRRVKEKFPDAIIVAVDIEGSVIFDQKPMRRFISGIGASMVPAFITNAFIDRVVIVSHKEAIAGCHELLMNHQIFSGASTGAVYAAIARFCKENEVRSTDTIAFICADKGYAYMDTVYKAGWLQDKLTHATTAAVVSKCVNPPCRHII